MSKAKSIRAESAARRGVMTTLATKSVKQLRDSYRKATGEGLGSLTRDQLIKALATRAEVPEAAPILKTGGKTVGQVVEKIFAEYSKTAPASERGVYVAPGGPYEPGSLSPKPRDPRLPPAGETIHKTYKGRDLAVEVLEKGFRFDGREWRSLTAIAMAVTGAPSINGPLFFGIAKRGAGAPHLPAGIPQVPAAAPQPDVSPAKRAKRARPTKRAKRRYGWARHGS